MSEADLKNIVESILFAADEPLSLQRFTGIITFADASAVKSALDELAVEYEARGGGFWLKEVAGGWRLRTRPEYGEWVRKLKETSGARLSRAAMETLSIIAYRQPVLRSDIEHIRGVDSGGIIRTLLGLGLIKVPGRKDAPGRPMLYATTDRFLEVFDLKDLGELPTLDEIRELTRPPEENL